MTETKWTLIFYDSLSSNVFACGSQGEARETWLEMLAFRGGTGVMTLI